MCHSRLGCSDGEMMADTSASEQVSEQPQAMDADQGSRCCKPFTESRFCQVCDHLMRHAQNLRRNTAKGQNLSGKEIEAGVWYSTMKLFGIPPNEAWAA